MKKSGASCKESKIAAGIVLVLYLMVALILDYWSESQSHTSTIVYFIELVIFIFVFHYFYCKGKK
jgi:hypothetical protein